MKSHFQFTNKQRNGIFLLLLIIVVFQSVNWFVDYSNDVALENNTELNIFRREVDSLKLVELENRKPKIYPFNPNYITDYKGYTLGLTNEEIDRLHKFRAGNQWVNSTKDFQKVTKVSDSVLKQSTDDVEQFAGGPDAGNKQSPTWDSFCRPCEQEPEGDPQEEGLVKEKFDEQKRKDKL